MTLLAARRRTGASFARGASKQDYATPRIFLDAVERRFGKITWDLAATRKNRVAPGYFGSDHSIENQRDALACNWSALRGNLWLNPPFDRIAPWAAKCVETSTSYTPGSSAHPQQKILFLVPAAVGANWWRDYVHKKALVLFLNGRLSFDGKNPYPKDCALACYGAPPDYECWPWRT